MNNRFEELAGMFGFQSGEGLLRHLYLTEQQSILEISSRCKVSHTYVLQMLIKYSIPRRGKGGANNTSTSRLHLHLMDQRLFEQLTNREVAKKLRMHSSIVWRYRKEKHQDGIRDNQSDGGIGEVQPSEPDALGPTAGDEPVV